MSRGLANTTGSTLVGIAGLSLLIYPLIGLACAFCSDFTVEELPPILTGRSQSLLFRSLLLASAASFACMAVSLPAALALHRAGRGTLFATFIALMAATILAPPMIYAFGWQRLLPTHLPSEFRCVIVWVLWAWPIPAWLLGSSISAVGQSMKDAARLETGGLSLFVRIVLPHIAPALLISFLVLLVLFLGDYGVPHAFGLSVPATDLLSRAESSASPRSVIVASIPVVVIILAALLGARAVWSRFDHPDETRGTAYEKNRPFVCLLTAGGYFVVGWIVPMFGLIPRLTAHDFTQSWVVYGGDFTATMLVSTGAGVASVVVALFALHASRLGRCLLVMAVFWGAVPAALVGESLVASFNRPMLGYFYDRWPIMLLAYWLRFGWIGVASVLLAQRLLPRDLEAQAALDGATGLSYFARVFAPNTWPMLVVGSGIVAVLSLGDVAASTLVRIPSFNPIAHVIIEKFHRLEDGMMISLSLNITIAVALAAALIVRAARPPVSERGRWGLERRNPRDQVRDPQ